MAEHFLRSPIVWVLVTVAILTVALVLVCTEPEKSRESVPLPPIPGEPVP